MMQCLCRWQLPSLVSCCWGNLLWLSHLRLKRTLSNLPLLLAQVFQARMDKLTGSCMLVTCTAILQSSNYVRSLSHLVQWSWYSSLLISRQDSAKFAEVGHAKAAQSLNGKLEIVGRYIKVSSVSEHVSGQDAGTNTADFDDDYGGGLSLNAQSRALLMQKLDRTGTASSIAGSLGLNGLNGSAPTQHPFPLPFNGQAAIPALPSQVPPVPVSEPIGNPSECLLLKNLFDPATETDPEFDLDIKDDVGGECSKFGRVRHIRVDRHSDGYVYLRFDNKEDAMSAQRGMHMRWFARRLISAIFVQPQNYERKFPDVVW